MCCNACPFAMTDESEIVQNYGCLPTPWDIIQLKKQTGANWACHCSTVEKGLKLCKGFVEWNEEMKLGLDIKEEQPKIAYELWYSEPDINKCIIK